MPVNFLYHRPAVHTHMLSVYLVASISTAVLPGVFEV